MVFRSSLFRSILLLILLFTAAGCAGTKVVNSWKEPGYGNSIKKVYIVGISKDAGIRKKFEDQLAERLQEHDVVSIPSHRDLTISKNTSREDIAEKLVDHDADTLLLTRAVAKRETSVSFPNETLNQSTYGPTYYNRGGWTAFPPAYYRLYGYYFQRIRQEALGAYPYMIWETSRPPTHAEFEIVTLEVNLYDRETEGLIWSAQFETVVEKNTDLLLQKLIKTVVRDMTEKNLI